jgi:hypothetical protein
MTDAARTPYARATQGYDCEHERELLAAITNAIIASSMISDANVCALRTAEITSALLTALASVLALSPTITRSPSQIRKTLDELRRRLCRRHAEAERSDDLREFVSRCFTGADVGGRA